MADVRELSPRPDTVAKTLEIAERLLEKKADRLVAFNLEGLGTPVEAAVVVTAGSVRHAQGLADYVLDYCKQMRYEFLHMEGYTVGQWILLDLNDIAVHVFLPESRDLYRLDNLWPTAPILRDTREEGAR